MQPIKRISLIILGSFAGIIALASLLAYVYKDKVKQYVVASLNKNLTAKIEVEEITFSFLSSFPYASVEFTNIKAAEARDFVTTGTVMNANSLKLLFNLGAIFNENYAVKKIVLKNASLNLQVAEDGTTNYNIWKTDTAAGKAFRLELQQVAFENVNVLYYNVAKQQDFSFLVKSGKLKGDFGNTNYSLITEGELENVSIIIEKVKYLTETTCDLQLALDVDKSKGKYVFKDSELKLAGLTLELLGTITEMDNYLELDLAVNSPGADLPALLTLIPKKYTAGAEDYNYSGDIEFKGSFKGRLDKTNSPQVAFTFVSKNAFLNPKNSPYKLKNLNGKGYFTNRKNKANPVTYLKLENFSASLEGKPIKANIEIENFNRPKLNIVTSFEADLNALSKFFKPDTLEEISGLAIVDATFNGISGEKATYRSSGNILFKDVSFRLKQKPLLFKNFNGLFHLHGNDLLIESLNGEAGTSDFSLKGSFMNLFAWLMTENQPLNISASLNCRDVNLDELMAKDMKSASAGNDTVYRLDFSDKLRLDLDIDIAHLQFKKFHAESIIGSVALEKQLLSTRQLDFNTVNGNVRLSGSIHDRPSDSLKITCEATINNLDVNKLFYEMGNFGQEVIVDKNLKGRVSAQISFRSMWSNRLDLDESSIYAKSNFTIENGELINLESLLALSKFLKGADLKTVKFSNLTNTIEIKNRKIYIPLMEIKSSAIDISASGVHTFDNQVDYKLRLYLSQIMGRKVKAQNTEFGTIEDDGLGRPMLYLNMKGPAADPKFTWDRQGVEQKISTEIRNESKNLKTILKQEFGKKDTSGKRPPAVKKKEEMQIEYEEDADL
ncbi:MAG: DUF3971 domain-containing protein [Bacteroidota bacterium]|nr:DUF3971 domain-containing protein [Bacteroidota bacterium]